MFQLVYLSSATAPFSKEDLAALLEKSRTNNRPQWITGMLLHHDGSFLQVLEGDEAAVRALAARIAKDPRHEKFVVLHEEQITQRMFPDWSMGFRDLDAASAPDGFTPFMNSTLSMASLGDHPSRAKLLLMAFKTMRAQDLTAPANDAHGSIAASGG